MRTFVRIVCQLDFKRETKKMKILFLVIFVFRCAYSVPTIHVSNVQRYCIETYMEKKFSRGHCREVMASIVEKLFEYNEAVQKGHRGYEVCYMKHLLEHPEIAELHIEYLYRNDNESAISIDLRWMLDQIMRAIDQLCRFPSGWFDIDDLPPRDTEDRVLFHCAYVHGVLNNWIDERIFNFRKENDTETCKPYQETLKVWFPTVKVYSKTSVYPSNFENCYMDKVEKRLFEQPFKLLRAISAHQLSKEEKAALQHEMDNYYNIQAVYAMACIKEISDSRKNGTYQPLEPIEKIANILKTTE